ncbi:hypothetical protein BWQ96_10597 [Gracilariopsis chorda]|uniref:Uncharacterized protein n=1 Tax=Gracilariopsis chorda TaxID=448386 RepID=A0A2V3IC66_9FLOR|nr:hypothetical protein BWQ96_10597 [Gracilariopsis chorda]|eukprot:PXF39697.1 hypothetical protein BWQ96_10597 [Gracilariopsis chorda]
MAADELFSALQDENTESRRNAIEIVQDRGLTSVQEELSRPALVQDEGTMLLHMAIASLDLSLGATLETIHLQRSSNERSSSATFEAAATALKVNILKTGCKSIDHILGGGILVNGGSIIEISGKSWRRKNTTGYADCVNGNGTSYSRWSTMSVHIYIHRRSTSDQAHESD